MRREWLDPILWRERLRGLGWRGALLAVGVAAFALVLIDAPVPADSRAGRLVRQQYFPGHHPLLLWYVEFGDGSAKTVPAREFSTLKAGDTVCVRIDRSLIFRRESRRIISAGSCPE